MPPIITVENLSKRYIIGHQKQGSYATLRDALVHGANRVAEKLIHPFTAKENDSSREEFWALNDISFEIQQGDRVGIIGRNGAGKSTLLKILSRITEPTSGKISIKGRVASLLEVGTGFHPELTGRENIFLNGAILGMTKSEIKSRFDEIVTFAEVEKFLDTPVKRYSSGMYVRLAFAVAAHLEPEILIVDEVLAVGDAQFQKKCLGKMEDAGNEGRTVLFVSHNMAVINRLCPRCIYLDRGNLVAFDDTSSVVERYVTAGFSNLTGEIVFSGGEDKDLQFISARTVDSAGTPKVSFRSDEAVRVIVTYRVKRRLSGVSAGISVLTAEQTPLWNMTDWEAYPGLLQRREPGTWSCEWVIPAHILKPARYFIACGAANPPVYYHYPDSFGFEITPDGTQRLSYSQFGVKGGPIALRMDVKTDALPSLANEVHNVQR